MTSNKGFTLIEMVGVIVILGVLAATAAPKFIDLSKDAREAVLQQISVSVEAANNLLNIKSKVPSYSVRPVPGRDDLIDIDMDLDGVFDPTNGVDIRLKHNYIDNTHIHLLIELDDEFVRTELGADFTYIGYDLDSNGSAINDECHFIYTQARNAGDKPEYTINTDGC